MAAFELSCFNSEMTSSQVLALCHCSRTDTSVSLEDMFYRCRYMPKSGNRRDSERFHDLDKGRGSINFYGREPKTQVKISKHNAWILLLIALKT